MDRRNRALRLKRVYLSFALTALLALGAAEPGTDSFATEPGAPGQIATPNRPTLPGFPTPRTATHLNSSPQTSAGTFPGGIDHFSSAQSATILATPSATPSPIPTRGGTPLTPNRGFTPFGNPTPPPGSNPAYPR